MVHYTLRANSSHDQTFHGSGQKRIWLEFMRHDLCIHHLNVGIMPVMSNVALVTLYSSSSASILSDTGFSYRAVEYWTVFSGID